MSSCLTEPQPATPQATLIGQIAFQAEATPQALAISAPDVHLTYRNLQSTRTGWHNGSNPSEPVPAPERQFACLNRERSSLAV